MEKRGSLAKNTLMLYVLTFSSQMINIVLIPFETRVLGPTAYGIISLAVSLSLIMTVVLDFGFLLSATARVVNANGDRASLSNIVANVTAVKLALSAAVGFLIMILVSSIKPFENYPTVFTLYYLAYVFNALLPDFLYRGLEYMKAITVRTVTVRVLCALPIFIFLRSASDLAVIPFFLMLGNFGALAFSFIHIKATFSIDLKRPSLVTMFKYAKESLPFFISRFASTFYQSMNTVILGYLYPGQSVVGRYGAVDKFMSLTKSVSSPIADSVYPYMIRTKNYRLCKKLLLISSPLILVASILAFVWADQICFLAFGPGYEGAGLLFRALLPAIAVIFPTYVLCFPVLVPLGLSKYANVSNVIGAIIQITSLVTLVTLGCLNALTLCISASISEVSVFIFRLYAAIHYGMRKKS